jgi:hypothetical protein
MRSLTSLEKERDDLRARHTAETTAGEWQRADTTRRKLLRVLDAIHDLKEKADGLLESVPVCLTEMGDSEPYPTRITGHHVFRFSNNTPTRDRVEDTDWQFTVGGIEYEISCYQFNHICEFDFKPKASRGYASPDRRMSVQEVMRIYATVAKTVLEYARKHNPGIIEILNKDKRRTHIVQRIAKKLEGAWDYKIILTGNRMVAYKGDDNYPEAKALLDRAAQDAIEDGNVVDQKMQHTR